MQISLVQLRKQTDQHRRIHVNADSATMRQLDHCAALEVEAYFKENASRHRVLPTLSDQPAKYQTRQICGSPVFLPRRDGGHQRARTYTPPRTAAEPSTRTKNNKEARSRSTSKDTQRNAQRQQHARASSTENHAAPNPRSRDRAAGQKDQPEPPGEKQKMRTTRGSSMQLASKKSRTVTSLMACATHGEASEHSGINNEQRTSGLSRSHRSPSPHYRKSSYFGMLSSASSHLSLS